MAESVRYKRAIWASAFDQVQLCEGSSKVAKLIDVESAALELFDDDEQCRMCCAINTFMDKTDREMTKDEIRARHKQMLEFSADQKTTLLIRYILDNLDKVVETAVETGIIVAVPLEPF